MLSAVNEWHALGHTGLRTEIIFMDKQARYDREFASKDNKFTVWLIPQVDERLIPFFAIDPLLYGATYGNSIVIIKKPSTDDLSIYLIMQHEYFHLSTGMDHLPESYHALMSPYFRRDSKITNADILIFCELYPCKF